MFIAYRFLIYALLPIFLAIPAQAALIDRGGGFIYDDLQDVTWLQNANYAAGSSYDSGFDRTDGLMTWDNAIAWAAALSIVDERIGAGGVVYDDWRLPRFTDTGDPGCDYALAGTDCGSSVDTSTSEMASLFFDTLGNISWEDSSGNFLESGYGFLNKGPFINGLSAVYWTGTPLAPDVAWVFITTAGTQVPVGAQGEGAAWAVRSGDVAVVPAPAAGWMLGLSLFSLGLRRQRRPSNSSS